MRVATLHQVLILFLMGGIGFTLAKVKIWQDRDVAAFTSMIIWVANPCLNFSKLERLEHGSLTADWLLIFFFSLALLCVLLGAGTLIFRGAPRDRRAVYAQMLALSNCGFMGYPVMEAALGPQAVGYGVAFVSAFNLVSWSVALALFCSDWKTGLWKMVNPGMIAIVLGLLVQVAGVHLPGLLADTVVTLGNLATPLSMMIAGAYLARVTGALFRDRRFLPACALRLIAAPLIAAAALKLFGLRGDMAGAVYVACAMPASTNMMVQASAYSTEDARILATGGVAVTTALSVATIPVMTLLLQIFA